MRSGDCTLILDGAYPKHEEMKEHDAVATVSSPSFDVALDADAPSVLEQPGPPEAGDVVSFQLTAGGVAESADLVVPALTNLVAGPLKHGAPWSISWEVEGEADVARLTYFDNKGSESWSSVVCQVPASDGGVVVPGELTQYFTDTFSPAASADVSANRIEVWGPDGSGELRAVRVANIFHVTADYEH